MSNYQNNNTGNNNEVYTPTTRSSYRFFNSNSNIDNTTMSFSYWNSLLKITINKIIVKEGSANKVDTDNHVDMYLSPSKAKMFLHCIQEYRKNPDAYYNIGVDTNRGAIFIGSGKNICGTGGDCIIINLINSNTGEVESSAVYEFNTKDVYMITDYKGGNNFTKNMSYSNSLELDMFENLLVQFINAYTNAVASSILEANKFNEAREYNFMKDVREKLGISKGEGNKNYNRSSWFSNGGSTSSSVSDSSSKHESSSYDDILDDIEASILD